MLSNCYQNGMVDKDEYKAIVHHKSAEKVDAAEMEDVKWINNVGHCYLKGIQIENGGPKISLVLESRRIEEILN